MRQQRKKKSVENPFAVKKAGKKNRKRLKRDRKCSKDALDVVDILSLYASSSKLASGSPLLENSSTSPGSHEQCSEMGHKTLASVQVSVKEIVDLTEKAVLSD